MKAFLGGAVDVLKLYSIYAITAAALRGWLAGVMMCVQQRNWVLAAIEFFLPPIGLIHSAGYALGRAVHWW